MRFVPWLACLVIGCVDPDPPQLRTTVTIVATQDGQPAEEATTRLVAAGRRSLVVIEAALHTADPAGRRRLVRAIDRLGDADGCALLAHVAHYDDDDSVRARALETLTAWAKQADERGAIAQRALATEQLTK